MAYPSTNLKLWKCSCLFSHSSFHPIEPWLFYRLPAAEIASYLPGSRLYLTLIVCWWKFKSSELRHKIFAQKNKRKTKANSRPNSEVRPSVIYINLEQFCLWSFILVKKLKSCYELIVFGKQFEFKTSAFGTFGISLYTVLPSSSFRLCHVFLQLHLRSHLQQSER